MDSGKQKRKRKREKLTRLVCNRSFDDDYRRPDIPTIKFIYVQIKWMHFFDIFTMYFIKLFRLF